MSRLVVVDAGPLIHLEQADALQLLELTGEILIPKTVLDELERGPTDVSELDFSVAQVDSNPESDISIWIRGSALHSWSVPVATRYS